MNLELQTKISEYSRFQTTFGARCSTIYDLKSGQIHHLNGAATKMLKNIAIQSHYFLENENQQEIFQELLRINYLNKDGLINNETIQVDPIPAKPLKKIWIELTNRCNQKCVHCYATASPNASDGLESKKIQSFLKSVFKIGLEAIQFTGGEPLLREDIGFLIDYSKKNGVKEIEIFSNLSTDNKPLLDKIAKSNVIVSTTVLAPDAATHDYLTKLPGSFERMTSNVKYLQNAGVMVNASIILMSETEDRHDEIIKFCENLNLQFREPDSVRPFGRGRDSEIKCKKYQNVRKGPFFESSPRSFLYAKHFNSCWGNMLFLRYDGKVVPCPHARDLILGDIQIDTFRKILSSSLSKAWLLTLDDIETCKNCEFRYICTDCRPLAYEGDIKKLRKKNERCLYNPYEGKWKSIA